MLNRHLGKVSDTEETHRHVGPKADGTDLGQTCCSVHEACGYARDLRWQLCSPSLDKVLALDFQVDNVSACGRDQNLAWRCRGNRNAQARRRLPLRRERLGDGINDSDSRRGDLHLFSQLLFLLFLKGKNIFYHEVIHEIGRVQGLLVRDKVRNLTHDWVVAVKDEEAGLTDERDGQDGIERGA